MIYTFDTNEIRRFTAALCAATAIPFIDSIEDFVVEAIFAYTRGITIPDPFTNTRSKKLYDVVDTNTRCGWSVKSLLCSYTPGCRVELVIQRADIFKKARQLGYDSLSEDSEPSVLGQALLRHWHRKINEDAVSQHVNSKRVFILLKQNNTNNSQYALFEEDIHIYNEEELSWQWTDDSHTGLQGIHNGDNKVIYRWYPNQKQLFEGFFLPNEITNIQVTPTRLGIAQAVDLFSEYLANNP